jgi:hypothetical protein
MCCAALSPIHFLSSFDPSDKTQICVVGRSIASHSPFGKEMSFCGATSRGAQPIEPNLGSGSECNFEVVSFI